MALLDRIQSPGDLKKLRVDELPQLADEVRELLVRSVEKTGGHLASNLGVVEMTIAMMYVYDFPQDKVVWDVGHQSYVYKILTGRADRMDTLRSMNGLCGFPSRAESRYDSFNTGHSSTSISAALGIARARDLRQGNSSVLAVIGDGALTGGMAWEALNDVGFRSTQLAVILNDNNMSISKNVGGLAKYLGRIRLTPRYLRFKGKVRRVVAHVPHVYRILRGFQHHLRLKYVSNKLFEQIGLKYVGPINGHDIEELIEYFTLLKNFRGPALAYHDEERERGLRAESNPTKYHGIDRDCALGADSFSSVCGSVLCEMADADRDIVAITAAMTNGTGLKRFADRHHDRFFDVGIAEQHAVTLAAGLAVSGMKPYVAIYSTFLQRAYDQILHDVCLQNLPVVFCVDRAGVSNGDGATHNGLYDLAFLRSMPNMRVWAPKNTAELSEMLRYARDVRYPVAIRYPKSCALSIAYPSADFLHWQILRLLCDVNVIVCGDRMLRLAGELKENVGIVYASYTFPCDETVLRETLASSRFVYVLEDGTTDSGLFGAICSYYVTHSIDFSEDLEIIPVSLPNEALKFGSSGDVFGAYGISVRDLSERIKSRQ